MTAQPHQPCQQENAMNLALDPEKFYRTDDMSLATILKIEGHTPQQVGWIGENCYWWVLINDDLMDCIASFDAGETRVEPREYNRVFHKIRKQMFATKESSPTTAAS
jgi:hypothetical protein